MPTPTDRPLPVVLPVRLSKDQYKELAALAALDQRTRCSMVRKLITEAARHLNQEPPKGAV
ncbi:MAG: hypothetical protein E8D52_05985 [Nitrospira sp.]|nr:MAG: hypothetical protein E8D52_05985 [Nitrospira sp.]